MSKPEQPNRIGENTIECPGCDAPIDLPEDLKDGKIFCNSCDATYFFGRRPEDNAETAELAQRYYKFIAPEMIALNKKSLLFNEMYPEAELFTEETLQETLETISELEALLDPIQEPSA